MEEEKIIVQQRVRCFTLPAGTEKVTRAKRVPHQTIQGMKRDTRGKRAMNCNTHTRTRTHARTHTQVKGLP